MHWEVSYCANFNNLSNYLDDFLFVGPSTSDECAKLMHIFSSVCKNLGVPIATDKTDGPNNYITYLGLGINSIYQTLFIPHDKVTSLTEQLIEINNHKKVTLQQLQSLCGLLAFCSRALPPARAFIRRFYGAMAGAHKPHHMIRVN